MLIRRIAAALAAIVGLSSFAIAESSVEPIGGIIAGDLSIASGGGGSVDYAVFGRGSDGALWWRAKLANGNWAEWAPIVSQIHYSPACTVMARRIFCAFAGADDGIYYIYQTATGSAEWSAPIPIDGKTKHGPAVTVAYASSDTPSLEVLVRGTDGQLFLNTSTQDGKWNGWTALGAKLSSAPACEGSTGDSTDPSDDIRLCAYRSAKDNVIYATSGFPLKFANAGGMSPSKPTIVSMPGKVPYRMFVQGLDNILWVTDYKGGWGQWRSTGIAVGASPACLVQGGKTICASKGADNSVSVSTIDNADLK